MRSAFILVMCIVLFTVGVILAAPHGHSKRPSSVSPYLVHRWPWPPGFKYSKSHEPILYKTAKDQRISEFNHPLGSTRKYGPRYFSNFHSLPSPDKLARSQWLAPAAHFVGGDLGSRVLNNVIDCRVCGKCNAKVQQYTDNEEKSAKIMALVQFMDEISAAKQTLNALIDKKLGIADSIANAEVQFSELAEFNSIGDALGNAGDYLKGAAKKIPCG